MLHLAPTLEGAGKRTLEIQPYEAAHIYIRPFEERSDVVAAPNTTHAPYKVKR